YFRGSDPDNVYFKVYSMPTAAISDSSVSCDRPNEAPNASNVKVLPLNASLGDDLICNYSYLDPENFEEKDSTYKWYKNGVNQNISSQTLAKGNLSLNDKWACYVTPSDGLLNGTERVSSNNVTIVSTISNPKMYVESQQAWNKAGSWAGEEYVYDFEDELNNALDSCTADSEGYCNITLSFSSDTNGTLNLSNMEIYYVIPTSESNITINNMSIVYSNNLNKIFEFIIQNPTSTALNASWSMDMGDGTTITSNQNITLTSREPALVFVEYNYTNKGAYAINVTARAGNLISSANISAYVGDIIITEFSEIYANKLNTLFAFTILNNKNSALTNINWSLNTGETTIYTNNLFNLSSGETILVFVEYNYTNYGTYTIIAAANATGISHSKTISTAIRPPLNIYNLSHLYANGLNNLFEFRVENIASWGINFTNVNWSFNTGENIIRADKLTSIASNESMLYYIEYNYTNPGKYIINATVFNGTYTNSANITVEISPINVYDLTNIYSNSLNRLFGFKVNNRNSWNINITNLNWTFNTGESNISAKLLTQIAKNETVLYYLEYNYTSAGTYNINVTTFNGTYSDSEQMQVTVS
ncbi:hypothetical protein HYU06_02695, partial [Candidatus Woesearchaeota archaeon]|nr:hypothetical protein [Candidatus Woesearchaeota archaeon]